MKHTFKQIEEDSLIDFCLAKGYITMKEVKELPDYPYRQLCLELEEKHNEEYWQWADE